MVHWKLLTQRRTDNDFEKCIGNVSHFVEVVSLKTLQSSRFYFMHLFHQVGSCCWRLPDSYCTRVRIWSAVIDVMGWFQFWCTPISHLPSRTVSRSNRPTDRGLEQRHNDQYEELSRDIGSFNCSIWWDSCWCVWIKFTEWGEKSEGKGSAAASNRCRLG